jgi:hypothetical protein
MRATFTDTIEVKMTLDTDDIKSICDNVAEDFPHESKDDFFDRALKNIIYEYFDGYTWYREDMSVWEVEEMCPTIIEKMIEYIDWYIVHYYLTEQEDFKWSDN